MVIRTIAYHLLKWFVRRSHSDTGLFVAIIDNLKIITTFYNSVVLLNFANKALFRCAFILRPLSLFAKPLGQIV